MNTKISYSIMLTLTNFVLWMPILTQFYVLLFLAIICVEGISTSGKQFIQIRGAGIPQNLPTSATNNWKIWTFDSVDGTLLRVEGAGDADGGGSAGGWVNPTSVDQLFLPADLPAPRIRPALGMAINNGMLRYAMPSVVASLETPQRVWRNRGLCSLPRAAVWLDLLSPYLTESLQDLLVLTMFGKSAPDVRFLEDQDGSAAWESLVGRSDRLNYAATIRSEPVRGPAVALQENVVQSRHGFFHLHVHHLYQRLKQLLESGQLPQEMYDGFHFVDIPVCREDSGVEPLFVPLPQYELAAYLGSFPDTSRLLELEDSSVLDSEPIAELRLRIKNVAAGGTSEFLPEVYRDLYEEGNILFT